METLNSSRKSDAHQKHLAAMGKKFNAEKTHALWLLHSYNYDQPP